MACIISKEEFTNLKKDSEIPDIKGNVWTVKIAHSAGPKHYPTNFLRCPYDGNEYRIFHNGKHLCVQGEKIEWSYDTPLCVQNNETGENNSFILNAFEL